MISFQNVTKTFGSHTVLDRVNFQILPNEMVVLHGVSGAGKSTVVNLLIGSAKPDEGVVSVDDWIVNEMNDPTLQLYRRRVGVVHQDYKLLPKKTAFENVAFAMEVCEEPGGAVSKRVPEVLEKVGLQDHRHQFPDQLSGGERQRLAIARAMVLNPRFLIADEPTGNLDEWNAREIIALFKQLHAEGSTILLTTHDPLVRELTRGRTLFVEAGRVF